MKFQMAIRTRAIPGASARETTTNAGRWRRQGSTERTAEDGHEERGNGRDDRVDRSRDGGDDVSHGACCCWSTVVVFEAMIEDDHEVCDAGLYTPDRPQNLLESNAGASISDVKVQVAHSSLLRGKGGQEARPDAVMSRQRRSEDGLRCCRALPRRHIAALASPVSRTLLPSAPRQRRVCLYSVPSTSLV